MTEIGLMSDTHGLLRNEVHEALAGVSMILHAGDVCSDTILDELALIAPVQAVYGNCDSPWGLDLKAERVLEVEGVRIHLSHGHELGRPTSARLAEAYPGFDVIVYGHTHIQKAERVGKEAIPEKDSDRVSPLCVGGRLVAPHLRTVHDVIVDKRRNVDQLQDDGQVHMRLCDLSGGPGGKKCQRRPQPLAARPANIGHVSLDSRIERLRLLADPALDGGQVRVDQLERLGERNRLALRHFWHGKIWAEV